MNAVLVKTAFINHYLQMRSFTKTAFVNSAFFLKYTLFCAETIYLNNLHNDQTQPDKYRNVVIN